MTSNSAKLIYKQKNWLTHEPPPSGEGLKNHDSSANRWHGRKAGKEEGRKGKKECRRERRNAERKESRTDGSTERLMELK